MAELTVKIRIAWWFRWLYLPLFLAMAKFVVNYIDADFEPNWGRLSYWLGKALITGRKL